MVPVTYADVLQRVPGFHARPPYLPHDSEVLEIAPPHDGYDLVFHVGVGRCYFMILSDIIS
jgi:pyroglutamyl-peptidase